MKIYLAGPMRGIPHFNFPEFHRVAAELRAKGHSVFNPAERDIERHGGVDISANNFTGSPAQAATEHGFKLNEALRDDTAYICMEADAICLLPGWENSPGAKTEHQLCAALGRKFFYINKEVL